MAYSNDNELGALWKRKSQKGTTFLTGKIKVNNESIDVVVFQNTEKKSENSPDYRILKSQPRPQNVGTLSAPKNAKNAAPRPRQNTEPVEEDVSF